MKNQEHEDAAKATIKAAIEAATNAATLLAATAMPMACVADASHATRTFLANTLEGFGFATSECAQLTALNAALDAGPPVLVVIGSSAFKAVSCAHSLVAKPKPSSVSVRNVRVA